MNDDRRHLDLAARLALRGLGRVEPNPLVGCVIVRDGRVIGMGHHRRFGGPHAEIDAINDCLRRGQTPRGATVYVTLEPCNGTGRNPPCAGRLIELGVGEVVYACADPNPLKAGGADALRAAGIAARLSDASPAASALAAPFLLRMREGRPWVIAKWAQTIDGRIATRTGESKWISNEASRRRVHRLRARVDAVLTGIGTVIADDPMLTARGVVLRRTAARVVVDTDLDLAPETLLARTAREVPTIVACDRDLASSGFTGGARQRLEEAGVIVQGVPPDAGGRGLDLRAMLERLWKERSIATLMVEAGPGLLGSMCDADLIDEAVVYVAPMLLGDEHAKGVAAGRLAESLSQARRFDLIRTRRVGNDVELTYRRRREGP
ncbi:MAG: bifunctional diaminohydroxyphosphoribosylaminopyrimidine deaminase/5-amino-6-(5-phosphoribosylamino)uracil reductase RibD [Phycisphaerales bacterium]